jgi:hypothetical protein
VSRDRTLQIPPTIAISHFLRTYPLNSTYRSVISAFLRRFTASSNSSRSQSITHRSSRNSHNCERNFFCWQVRTVVLTVIFKGYVGSPNRNFPAARIQPPADFFHAGVPSTFFRPPARCGKTREAKFGDAQRRKRWHMGMAADHLFPRRFLNGISRLKTLRRLISKGSACDPKTGTSPIVAARVNRLASGSGSCPRTVHLQDTQPVFDLQGRQSHQLDQRIAARPRTL